MQMVLVENLALTFVGDAHALAAGFGKILVHIVTAPIARMVRTVTAPIDRIAAACDVAGVLSDRHATASLSKLHTRRHAPASSQNTSHRWCLFPFRSLNHLT
ncbi:hypothetical protein [Bradyrhizobium sp.]|uniref:hypothetical protein n=1 Tax=Bradyrhizobium sp. TaxID=376 RepID=UPI002D6D03EE|nr:hypothetical protein [Bradyrhizobium sp.]HZR74713.1 hypothetical protein [Bradyrhizobium sp.]